MTDNENKIIEAVGEGGKSKLKLSLLTQIPLKQVNRLVDRLHNRRVLSMKSEDTYWISQQYTKQMEALNTVA